MGEISKIENGGNPLKCGVDVERGGCCGVVLGQGVGLALGTPFSRLSTTQPFLLPSSLVSSLE
jgi:hypothetical protein